LLRLRQKSVAPVTDLQQEDEPQMNDRACQLRGNRPLWGALGFQVQPVSEHNNARCASLADRDPDSDHHPAVPVPRHLTGQTMNKTTNPKQPSRTVKSAEAEAHATGKDKTEYGRVSRSKHVTDRKTVKSNPASDGSPQRAPGGDAKNTD